MIRLRLGAGAQARCFLGSVRSAKTIHDHLFSLHSHVLCGELVNVELEVTLDDEGEFEVWEQPEKCRNAAALVRSGGQLLARSGERARISARKEQIIAAGESYTFPALSFHDNHARGLTATVMEKTERLPGRARVLVPAGREPSTAVFEHDVPLEQLWSIIEEALAETRRVSA